MRFRSPNFSDNSDAESALDESVGVAIITFGGEGTTMHFKVRNDAPANCQRFAGGTFKHEMKHNSIVLMSGPGFHKTYTYEIPIQKDSNQRRTSFTFGVHNGVKKE